MRGFGTQGECIFQICIEERKQSALSGGLDDTFDTFMLSSVTSVMEWKKLENERADTLTIAASFMTENRKSAGFTGKSRLRLSKNLESSVISSFDN